MLRLATSEALLSLFTARDRAAAIVGDLAELHPAPRPYWAALPAPPSASPAAGTSPFSPPPLPGS